ncbi:MAG: uracil-DNA glycosylase family protein [Eubacteriales bacterium]
MNLLNQITKCPNVQSCFTSEVDDHPCEKIVLSQKVSKEEFHVPEPWSGHLEKARILFLSSNPGVARQEKYPTSSWSADLVFDFFDNRFDSPNGWVKDGLFPLMTSGGYKANWVRFWAAIRRRAVELLDRSDISPGVDYAITEIVHCKSNNEIGVREALKECMNQYLDKVLDLSGAKVVVCLGNRVSDAIREKLNIPTTSKIHGPVITKKVKRYFAFLPHPNARGNRSFEKCMPDDLIALKRFLKCEQ